MRFLPLFAAIIAITPLAIDMYLPALPRLAESLNSSIEIVQTSLSLYLAGYAIGMFIFGPLADKIGRKPLLIGGLTGFIVCSLLLSVTTEVNSFLSLRFLQAMAGGAATVVIPGAIRELFGKHTAKGLSYVSMIMMIAPLLAPSIGGFLLSYGDWPLIFRVLATYAGLMLVLSIAFFPTPAYSTITARETKPLSFIRSYHRVLSHPVSRVYLMVSMLASLGFFTYLTSVSFLYMQKFGFNEQQFAGLFALNVVGLMLFSWINTRLVPRYGSPKILRAASLVALVIASIFLGLMQYQASPLWIIGFLIPLTSMMVLISANSDAMVLQALPQQSGTATAVIGTLKFGSGAMAGPLLAILFDGSGLPIAMIFFAAIALMNLRIRLFPLNKTVHAI